MKNFSLIFFLCCCFFFLLSLLYVDNLTLENEQIRILIDVSWDTSASLFPDEPTLRDVCFCNHDQIYLVLSATELEDFHGISGKKVVLINFGSLATIIHVYPLLNRNKFKLF